MISVPHIIVTNREGDELRIAGQPDRTVMETIRDGGVDELLALCGGCCSCATCHIYVDPAVAHLLPAMSDDESELLDSSGARNERSRLACQIPLNDLLDGLRVEVAPDT
jgi:2Fe-2S ferredoxin